MKTRNSFIMHGYDTVNTSLWKSTIFRVCKLLWFKILV